MNDEEDDDLGWHCICGADLLDLLRRAHDGESPDLLMLELHANSDHEDYRDE